MLCGSQEPTAADPIEWPARVVWHRDGRVYIAAAPDFSTIEPGGRLEFLVRGKTLASGEIAQVVDGELVVATITSGSLAGEKLDRVKLLYSRPWVVPPRLLRIGIPESGRRTFQRCDQLRPDSSLYALYRMRPERVNERTWWFVHDPRSVPPYPQPETLLVKLFDEAADEEIAFARGELDVAIFEPGELSRHMRDHPGWQDSQVMVDLGGAIMASGLASSDSTMLGAIHRDLFRGDLWPMPWTAPADSRSARYEIEPTWPRGPEIASYLARAHRPGSTGATRRVRLSFVEDPRRVSADSSAVQVYDVRHRVLYSAQLRPFVRAHGTNALVVFFECVGAP